MSARRSQRGFSLLEAIVALAILAAALAGAWTWIAGDVRALGRVRDLALEEAAVQQALAQLEQQDFTAQASGSLHWREFRIDWRADPLQPAQRGRTNVGGKGPFDLTLYRVELELRLRERLIATPELRMLRYARRQGAVEQP